MLRAIQHETEKDYETMKAFESVTVMLPGGWGETQVELKPGDFITEFNGSTWKVREHAHSSWSGESSYSGEGFLCDHIHGPQPSCGDRKINVCWIPVSNIKHRSVQGWGFFTIEGEGDDLEMVRYGSEYFTKRADALDALEAMRQKMMPGDSLSVTINGCGFVKAD